jgi:hypothetical protein
MAVECQGWIAPHFQESKAVKRIATRKSCLEHDPEKWKPVFREDHAQTKISAVHSFEVALR